jgi:hypothetical protein
MKVERVKDLCLQEGCTLTLLERQYEQEEVGPRLMHRVVLYRVAAAREPGIDTTVLFRRMKRPGTSTPPHGGRNHRKLRL